MFAFLWRKLQRGALW